MIQMKFHFFLLCFFPSSTLQIRYNGILKFLWNSDPNSTWPGKIRFEINLIWISKICILKANQNKMSIASTLGLMDFRIVQSTLRSIRFALIFIHTRVNFYACSSQFLWTQILKQIDTQYCFDPGVAKFYCWRYKQREWGTVVWMLRIISLFDCWII